MLEGNSSTFKVVDKLEIDEALAELININSRDRHAKKQDLSCMSPFNC